MNNEEKFLIEILRKIESLDKEVLTYAYKVKPDTSPHEWWEISVSSAELYCSDHFNKLTSAWYKIARIKKIGLLFVFRLNTSEELLLRFNERSLIMI